MQERSLSLKVRRQGSGEIRLTKLFLKVGCKQIRQFLPGSPIRLQIPTFAKPRFLHGITVPVRQQHWQILGAAKQRITAFAVEHVRMSVSRHMSSQFKVRSSDRISNRIIQSPNHFTHAGHRLSRTDFHFLMIRSAVIRNLTGKLQFVGVPAAEVDGERPHTPRTLPRQFLR